MSTEEYVQKIVSLNEQYSWRKEGEKDSIVARQLYFFGDSHDTEEPY